MTAKAPNPKLADAPLPDAHPAPRDADQARAMIERLRQADRQSTAELLQELRREFPHSPLAMRVRALAALLSR